MQKNEQEVYLALQGKHSLENIIVTKHKIQEWASKKIFDLQVSCRPGWVTANQHV